MKLLFIGESWLGSCARSLREALARRPDVELEEINEDLSFPKARTLWLRAVNRITRPGYRREFNAKVLAKVRSIRPQVVMTYKGSPVRRELVEAIRDLGAYTVNVYPDCSPHAHGNAHRLAVGAYDLVVSTKAFHPDQWERTYGYSNRCVFVPQGYDPNLHLVPRAPSDFRYDVVMIANHRAEYAKLALELASMIGSSGVRVLIGGPGWEDVRAELPSHWSFPGLVEGRAYVTQLRQGKICVAPVTRDVSIDGRRQPGDVDTTRTYELAAAHCFFVHRRTEFIRTLYDEGEVPLFENGCELGHLVHDYLGRDGDRAKMAEAAHHRAVPAYSMDARAAQIVEIVRRELG